RRVPMSPSCFPNRHRCRRFGSAPRIMLLLLLAAITRAADRLYVKTTNDVSARLSDGRLITVRRGSCFPFVRNDLSKAFTQVEIGSCTAWARRGNLSFVSKLETATAAAKYAAETKILARQTASYRSPKQVSRWVGDAIRAVAPQYPYEEKLYHHEGTGVFHLTIDRKTGLVTNVAVRKSTGFKGLDESAIAALRQWTWIPGTWREIDFPVTYKMAQGPQLPRSADRRLSNSL